MLAIKASENMYMQPLENVEQVLTMVQYSGIDHVITERRNINISLTYSLSWKSKCNETNNKSLNNIKNSQK
jgi:hypothetical protein